MQARLEFEAFDCTLIDRLPQCSRRLPCHRGRTDVFYSSAWMNKMKDLHRRNTSV